MLGHCFSPIKVNIIYKLRCNRILQTEMAIIYGYTIHETYTCICKFQLCKNNLGWNLTSIKTSEVFFPAGAGFFPEEKLQKWKSPHVNRRNWLGIWGIRCVSCKSILPSIHDCSSWICTSCVPFQNEWNFLEVKLLGSVKFQPDVQCGSEDVLAYLESCCCNGPDCRSWEKSECIQVLSPIWNAFFHCLPSVCLRWTPKFSQRGEADRALVTHMLQLLEIILAWFYATLSSRVLILKYHLCSYFLSWKIPFV